MAGDGCSSMPMGAHRASSWDAALTQAARLVYGGACAVGVVYSAKASWQIQAFWSRAREHAFVKHDSCEPVVASAAFMCWVLLFRLLDRVPWLAKYKMYPEESQRAAGQDLKPPKHAVYSLVAYLAPLLVFDFLYPRRILPHAAPSLPQLARELIGGLFVYDLLFFWLHIAMHKLPALRFVRHAQHHSKAPLDATQVVNHSLTDGSMQVLTNIVTLNLLRSHPLCRILHNIVITYLLTELHSGFDFPWMLHNVLPASILGGPPAHELHHRTGTQHFQQFFTYLDYSLGFCPPTERCTSRRGMGAELSPQDRDHSHLTTTGEEEKRLQATHEHLSFQSRHAHLTSQDHLISQDHHPTSCKRACAFDLPRIAQGP